MFTGIVQGIATIAALRDADGLRTLTLELPPGMTDGLELGASVAVDGVCLTVTAVKPPRSAEFDVMLQSLNVTTLGGYALGARVNVERAAKDGAEIGGHPLSGHIDFTATIEEIRQSPNNYVLRLSVPEAFRKYLFAKGYVAVNGCSLTIATIDKRAGWFEVWLIPETRRVTVFEDKRVGDGLNVEIERNTQVVVDTVRDSVDELLGGLKPVLEDLLRQRGASLEDLLNQRVPALGKPTKDPTEQ
jgi:riboflavin synthase